MKENSKDWELEGRVQGIGGMRWGIVGGSCGNWRNQYREYGNMTGDFTECH